MQRFIFLIMGLILLIHTLMDQQYMGTLLGVYITAMGLFGFGCAAGNCSIKQTKN